MNYVIKIKTIVHDDEYRWESNDLTDDFKSSTLSMFTEWALNDPENLPSVDGEDENLITDWIRNNLQGPYAFSSIGVGNSTHTYGYFDLAEDAMLFKMTWCN